MLAAWSYHIAAILLLLFASGHQLGFRQTKPEWGVDAVLASLKGVSFQVPGGTRTYYGFYEGFGFFVTVLLLFAALVAWQLGSLPAFLLASLPLVTWGLVGAFVIVSWLSWKYFFTAPLVFSMLVTILLLLGAWAAAHPTVAPPVAGS